MAGNITIEPQVLISKQLDASIEMVEPVDGDLNEELGSDSDYAV